MDFLSFLLPITCMRLLICAIGLLYLKMANLSQMIARYASLLPQDFGHGHVSQRLAHRIARNAPPPTNDLVNAFERVIERTQPELVAHYAAYSAAGAPRLHLCGAGPAVFLLVTEGAKIAELRRDGAAQQPLEAVLKLVAAEQDNHAE